VPEELPSLALLGQGGYIIEGWGHILSGYAKAGKTELLYACCVEWALGGHRVLILSEEFEAIWSARTKQHKTPPPGHLTIIPGRGVPPDELLARAAEGDEDIVIIDTLRGLLGLADENDNSEVFGTLNKWETALQGKTRIYGHHARKTPGEYGERIAGAGAFLGAIDRAIELERVPQPTNRRKLIVHSRIIEPPELLYELTADGEFCALGEAGAVELAEVEGRALDVLGDEFLSTKQVVEALGDPQPSNRQVLQALTRLWKRGQVIREPKEDKPGARYRWRAAKEAADYDREPNLAL